MDEWKFTLSLPENVPFSNDEDSQEEGQRTFILSRSQPAGPHPGATERMDSEETAALLSSPAAEPSRCHGWSFTSPYWNIQSNTLLTVTYSPGWQNIPEYTNHTCPALTGCMACCCCDARGGRDFTAHVFSVHDIVKVKKISGFEIIGVGTCEGFQVYLEPMKEEDVPRVPSPLQAAWEERKRRMVGNREFRDGSHNGPVVTFALPVDQTDPPLMWKVDFPGLQEHALSIETLSVFEGSLENSPVDYNPTHIYVNGFQSWSFAGSIVKGHKQPCSALCDVYSRAFNHGGCAPPHAETVVASMPIHHMHERGSMSYKSDFFACITSDGTTEEVDCPYQQLDEVGGPAVILGWLAQREQFGVVLADTDLGVLEMHASGDGQILLPGRTLQTDWAYAQLTTPHSYDEEPMAHYLHLVADHNKARPLQNGPLLTGWCSWYVFYENITASILKDNFERLATMRNQVPTNVSVVDDGYMTAWGDWDSLKPASFPNGSMGGVSNNIKGNSMRPGIWLAPFAADKHSKVAKLHPDWIIRNKAGKVANSSNCGKFFYGLDATNPSVREHVLSSIRRAVKDWDYDVLKLDFLYAACLEGNEKYDLSMSRANAMHIAMNTLREAAGSNVFLIGCGCPIASGIGFADAMRVSADTGPSWYPGFPLPWWDNGTLPALRAMIRNSISRAPMGHRWWHNDPDCLMFGSHTNLTDEEVASAASVVAMTCGMLLLSDDLPKVEPKRMRVLSKIFPLTGISAVVLDLHSTNAGLPSLLRLWCTDKFGKLDTFRGALCSSSTHDSNAEATHFAREASFRRKDSEAAIERERSCIHVTKGLGTWTVLSISNWQDKTVVVQVPPPAVATTDRTGDNLTNSFRDATYGVHGYHVFAFWSSRYSWIPDQTDGTEEHSRTIMKKLLPHETEIFHIKPVTPGEPQYIGSDLHFSCGKEVLQFRHTGNRLDLSLDPTYRRVGHVFVYIPRSSLEGVRVTVGGQICRFEARGNTPAIGDNGSHTLAGRTICIPVELKAEGQPHEGNIRIDF